MTYLDSHDPGGPVSRLELCRRTLTDRRASALASLPRLFGSSGTTSACRVCCPEAGLSAWSAVLLRRRSLSRRVRQIRLPFASLALPSAPPSVPYFLGLALMPPNECRLTSAPSIPCQRPLKVRYDAPVPKLAVLLPHVQLPGKVERSDR